MSRRPASAVIDLTSGSRHALQNHHGYHFNTHQEPTQTQTHTSPENPSRGVKRRRLSDDTIGLYSPSPARHTSSSSALGVEGVESVDLTEINDDSALSQVLAKQREDAVKAQAAADPQEGRTSLTATKCAICMDTPTDATTTICGHMFCHKCIIDSLRYDEERSEATTGKSNRGKCPACRKLISRRDAPGPRRDLVPLQFKLKRRS
ncbi:uncharacterized protein TRUGW13939_06363 [Talaromyces rugulosus]|uniref:RING-type domain-containing protein n=1 Tax=Talaromyces rugulosus TaxID=121627 RepID=A0A7H8R0M7_TALRU|nr:uncharacterized protein TRUGW13939_06363 [Talaromyces rugulosus]QKX59231.1 hypothetical protein TRUGW13939_06363 [Talaromyces rugulosus]